MSIEGKSRIIQAAKCVISRSGIAGATMRGIAEEAGLSTGAIYHYYSSKEDILYEVMDENLSETLRIAEKSKGVKRSSEELIEEIFENIVKRFEKTDENRIQLYLAQEAIQGNSELKEKFKDKYQEWVSRTDELMQHMYGKVPTKYSKALSSLLIGAIDGIVMQFLLGANPSELDDILKVYHHILKDGIPNFLDQLAEI
ncbi:TetR/AcrR family transcriptional regulator [Clostridium tagluense]|uniref:TetR/AcrR family transcriptional regulator n=1 Tax=Clostridium tagluense TaxID=360422 RepID=UPI001CF1BF4A|nr:TetR/AcrR family transcriptional regulator [Clostridium tagluense]MCB2310359.1 TetR/AcrR family transcriptional regulator [Clostridium tagluense]MCB2314999.1 TetR/AcrR family transcriptional regulator [Clostridium tagluense]MCB2320060.1 TetR/AcrR family transcriptional regulator [Clostridium tagluense]MCB2324742.1 TetR/AcrR family transcriptional regulator [Clostridium tagluense]MCB2329804.1 TetR/AcrR family transcriptional regulator [Clostridium tagluense]